MRYLLPFGRLRCAVYPGCKAHVVVAGLPGVPCLLSVIKVNLFESEEDVGLLSDEVKIIEMFKAGLKLFSPSFEIGCHYHKKRKVALRDSLCVVLQAKGSGKRPWIYQNYGMNQPNSLLTFCFIHWVRERLGANGWSESLVGIFSDKQQLPE